METQGKLNDQQKEEVKKVIECFLLKESASTENLESDGNRLLSCGTCIAEWTPYPIPYVVEAGDNKFYYIGAIIINSTEYNDLSTSHFCILFNILERVWTNVLRVSSIPLNTQSLWKERKM